MINKALGFITALAIPASLFLAATAAADVEQVTATEEAVSITAEPTSVALSEPAVVDAPILEEEMVGAVEPVNQTKSTKTIDTAEIAINSPEETIFRMMTTQGGVTWGLDRVDGTRDGSYNYISDGAGVRIYVVDTGVDATHREFGSRVTSGFDAFGENLANTDCQGHGTHVAGIAAGSYYGVAKAATVVPVRVLDCNGIGTTSTLTAGIEWILANHAGGSGVVNMSLGGAKDSRIDDLTNRLADAGLVVVVAAGNYNADACNYSPSSARGAISVGAVDNTDTKASFSNYGSCVDVWAPGVGIASANSLNHSSSLNKSGTSQAAPFVAGAIATYLSSGSANTGTAEGRMDELAQNGVVTVEVPAQEVADPIPAPVVEEPIPVVEEPAPTPVADPVYEVTVTQGEPGSPFGLLTWSQVAGAESYQIYKTGSIRPGWRLFWTTDSDGYKRTVSDKVGAIAIYRVVAIVAGSEVEIGEFQYEPTN